MKGHTVIRTPSVWTLFLTLVLMISYMTQPNSANSSSKTYIKTACNSTIYPQVCYKSLSTYASTIKTNPLKLCKAALSVTLNAARNTSSVVLKLLKQKGLKPVEAGIIKDCIANMEDSIDELKQSLEALGSLQGGSGVEYQIANIKTWISAALTDEDTCTDGFQGRNVSSTVKNKIRSSILSLAKLTSNALSIINHVYYT